jgi:hypothetical protein
MTCSGAADEAPYAGRVTTSEPDREPHPRNLGAPAPVEPSAVPTRAIIAVGVGLWLLALVVVLIVPSLHTGERSWWPWTCVTGVLLGVFAWWFVGRGRGAASDA